jgi:quinol-cytochrome oxidoreductase complex cytochrome b subunit
MATSDSNSSDLLFDYRILRLIVGIVAMGLPLTVYLVTLTVTSSISASYYTDARDVFVGALFVIGALFLAYQGHKDKTQEKWISNIGAIAAVCAAIYPTSCDQCGPDVNSTIHYIAAFILFSAVVYFCLFAFSGSAKAKISNEEKEKNKLQEAGGKDVKHKIERLAALQKMQARRVLFYKICGFVIAAIMLASVIASFALSAALKQAWPITFIAEAAALELFGIAWLTASKAVPFLAHEDERPQPFKPKEGAVRVQVSA